MPFDFAQGILSLSKDAQRCHARRATNKRTAHGAVLDSCGREEVDGSESRPCQHAASPES
jgi:hypothetical protein